MRWFVLALLLVGVTTHSLGFKTGRANPCNYYNESLELRVIVHVDDFVILWPLEGIRWFIGELAKMYEIKSQILGRGKRLRNRD